MPLFEHHDVFRGETGLIYRDMVNAHENTEGAERAIIILYNAGLLNGEQASEVLSYPIPDYVADTLATLQEGGLLSLERARGYRQAVMDHPKMLQFADGLVALHEAGLLIGEQGDEYCQLISIHPNPNEAGQAISVLEFSGILDLDLGAEHCQRVLLSFKPFISAHALVELLDLGLLNHEQGREYRDASLFHYRPLDFVRALGRLNSFGLLSGEQDWENREALHAFANPYEIADLLIILHTSGLLNGEIGRQNRQLLISHQNIGSLCFSIIYHHYMGLFAGEEAQENLMFLLQSQSPHYITNALMALYESNILRHELSYQNQQALRNNPNLGPISNALIKLHFSGFLDQHRLNQLLEFSEILCDGPLGELWHYIPQQVFMAHHFDAMIMRCQQIEYSIQRRQNNILRYLRRVMLMHLQPVARDINDDQSIHRASVHEAVSQSARNLMVRYGAQVANEIDCFRLYDVLLRRIRELAPTLVNSAALRFLERYDEELFDYVDPVSVVSTRQLLALCTLAIDDESGLKENKVSRLDAFGALVQGLYEVQRGYNLNATNIDDGLADAPICIVGTFSKLTSSLWGLHPDCTIRVISKETANAKLLPVIIEKAMAYLEHEQETRTRADFALLLRDIRNEQLTPIWEHINQAIYAAIEEEFGALLSRAEMDAAQDAVELDLSSLDLELSAAASAAPAASVATGGMFAAEFSQRQERDDDLPETPEPASNAGVRKK